MVVTLRLSSFNKVPPVRKYKLVLLASLIYELDGATVLAKPPREDTERGNGNGTLNSTVRYYSLCA
jgi:hypothetical protein